MVVVEVRQGAGGEETRRGDEERRRGEEEEKRGEEEEEEKEEDEDEEDEEEATDIKSNNPHLAGGEQMDWCGTSVFFFGWAQLDSLLW